MENTDKKENINRVLEIQKFEDCNPLLQKTTAWVNLVIKVFSMLFIAYIFYSFVSIANKVLENGISGTVSFFLVLILIFMLLFAALLLIASGILKKFMIDLNKENRNLKTKINLSTKA